MVKPLVNGLGAYLAYHAATSGFEPSATISSLVNPTQPSLIIAAVAIVGFFLLDMS